MQKISVVTINRNNAAGLNKTIRSVIAQSYSNIEYIVIDGASTDSSVEVIKEYSGKIYHWVSEPDKGIYNAMNKGIRRATGEYVIFMNSGDCFVNEEIVGQVFEQPQTEDLIAGYTLLEGGRIRIRQTIPDQITFYHFFVSTIWHQATFTKRVLFDELGGYDERMQICADWKFALLAIVKYNKNIKVIKKEIALIDASGISGSERGSQIIIKEREETYQEFFPYFIQDYQELYKLKRYSWERMRNYVKYLIAHYFFRR